MEFPYTFPFFFAPNRVLPAVRNLPSVREEDKVRDEAWT